MRRRHVETIRLSDEEREVVENFAKDLGISRSEVWRRMLTHLWILYQEELSLDEALKDTAELVRVHEVLRTGTNIPLYKALKSVPELVEILRRKGF
jgi:hypothetical protein